MPMLGDPILSCADAAEFERRLFGDDEAAAWGAMQRAGRAVARAVLRDFEEIGGFPAAGRILVLAGKGNNAGDAMIAAQAILERFPSAGADVVFAFGERALRPPARRAWRELAESAGPRLAILRHTAGSAPDCESAGPTDYALSVDGVFGYQFKPPIDPRAALILRWANRQSVRLRAAVDLPSGLNEPDGFRADFTYATGIVKAPILSCANAGRLRYLDLGFFRTGARAMPEEGNIILLPAILAPLAGLRPAQTDKRDYGHLFVVGGSRSYPGAVLMAVLAALRSGAGLVTAFVPESLAASFAARAPEAMWVGWPETPDGGLALEGRALLLSRIGRGTAVLLGPGLGSGPETLALAAEIAKSSEIPIVLDADALQADIVREVRAPHILTPHVGEFARIARGADLGAFSSATGATVVLKGPVTCIASGSRQVHYNFQGGPVLARGGSGDILAGLTGGLLAQSPAEPLVAACRGVVWHGCAADLLARSLGQTAVSVTQLLDFLPRVLREEL
jgi:NAD(P)H-hydrate epimerase